MSEYLYAKLALLISRFATMSSFQWFIALIFSAIAFFEPISMMMYLLIFTVAIDLISGLFKAWKTKQRISSFRLRDSVLKLFLYLAVTMIAYGVQVICLWNIQLANIVSAFIIFAELISISENLDVISNGKLGLAQLIKKLQNKWFKSTKLDE